MVRPLVLGSSVVLALACGDVDVDEGDPFGTSPTGSTAPEPTGAVGTGSATSEETASGSATEATGPSTATGTAGSTGAPPSTTGDESGSPGESSGNPGDGTLSECVGTGAWESCDQVCASTMDACVPSGCGGATVHYYGDVGDCTAMNTGSTSTQGCGEPFEMGGNITFARCCCG